MPPKRNTAQLEEAMKRARQTLAEEAFYYPNIPSNWRPNQGFAPAGNPSFIVPTPYQAPPIGSYNPFMPAPSGVPMNRSEPAMTRVDMPEVANVVAQQQEEVNLTTPQEGDDIELEGIASDEPAPNIYSNPFETEAQADDMDLNEEDFGLSSLYGNGVSGRRMMNHRRRMYY